MKRSDSLVLAGWAMRAAIVLAGLVFLVLWLVDPVAWHKPASYLGTLALPFVPDFLRLFRVQASPRLVLAYELFLAVAMVVGIDLDAYALWLVTAEGESFFDKIVHLGSGALTAVAALELLLAATGTSGAAGRAGQSAPGSAAAASAEKPAGKSAAARAAKAAEATGVAEATATEATLLSRLTPARRTWLTGLFLMGAVALVGVLWECFEFGYDQLTGGHMQELVRPGVEDTMWDLIMALIGGAVATALIILAQRRSARKAD